MRIGVVSQPQGILAWMKNSLAIVGPGRVGRAFGRRLKEAGWKITVIAGRSLSSAKRGARFIGDGRPAEGVPATLASASTILLTVPDDALSTVAFELARNAGDDLQGKIVLQTSGALDAGVLAPLHDFGAAVGSMHPLQTFSGVGAPPLEGKLFAIEGDPPAVQAARKIARTLGGVPVRIAAAKKPLYHAAGIFAAGLSLGMEEAGVRLLMAAGLKRREAQRALLALTAQVQENYAKLGPQKAWTGPLARGDFDVVATHEIALGEFSVEYLDAYRAVSRLSARVLSRNPEAILARLDEISGNMSLSGKTKGGYE
ncbi:MAG TPA: Rossmann-like and DUF2520 domain-containing protein [Candidatus Acidoferrum sp.]|nr:Rossmann-like and DUF2520 domain-containing protein [Candidatus Acidoferrum sp.]